MPRTSKKAVSRKSKKSGETFGETLSEVSTKPLAGRFLTRRKVLIILTIAGLALLFYYKKSWFIAATVNGQPITNLELQQELNKTYREQTLNKLVNDRIFAQFEKEATQMGIIIPQEQINQKIAEIETQYGGKETFDSLLAQQGISRADFEKQIKINQLAEKFFENDIKPTEEEIEKFMSDENNRLSSEATDAAKFRKLAEDEIRQDKLTTKLREKFQEIKSKVVTF